LYSLLRGSDFSLQISLPGVIPLQIITTLRAQLEERITGLQSVLDEVKVPDSTAREHHNEQLNASRTVHTRVDQLSEVLKSRADQLESAMKEQKRLMLALKSFLEDKTSRTESALENIGGEAKEVEMEASWPSSTLSAAYLAALLLSSVLSSVAVTSIVTRNHRSPDGVLRPMFLPLDYSLPGLGPLNKIRVQPSLIPRIENTAVSRPAVNSTVSTQVTPVWSTRDFVASTQAEPKDSSPTRVTGWLQDYSRTLDYSRTQRGIRRPEERKSRFERRDQSIIGYYSMGPGWSSDLSKLDAPRYPGEPDRDHDGEPEANVGEPNTGGFYVGPGPIIPSDNAGVDWRYSGVEGGSSSDQGGGDGGDGSGSYSVSSQTYLKVV
jgi:hypothetical protein